MTDHRNLLICGELKEDKIAATTKELLNMGRKLSDELNQTLSLLLIGHQIQEEANKAISLGADYVYLADGNPFSESLPECYITIIMGICSQLNPSIILFGHNDMGRDLAPRLAARLGSSVCMDCVELSIDPATKSLLALKPVYGGNAMALWALEKYQPHIITMRPRAAAPAESDLSRRGEIMTVSFEATDSVKSKLLETGKDEVKGIRLEEAKVVVAGGGGIGGKEGFQLVKKLAQTLGGAVGISRVPRDEGWMPSSLEIGQTGHMVSPNLYIAVGISGAPQHLAGCSGSKCIVAINKDPDAHIFKEADFGIVGDYREALPVLIDKCKTLLGS
jgi:electron transfer flavoprotein alpha subunit